MAGRGRTGHQCCPRTLARLVHPWRRSAARCRGLQRTLTHTGPSWRGLVPALLSDTLLQGCLVQGPHGEQTAPQCAEEVSVSSARRDKQAHRSEVACPQAALHRAHGCRQDHTLSHSARAALPAAKCRVPAGHLQNTLWPEWIVLTQEGPRCPPNHRDSWSLYSLPTYTSHFPDGETESQPFLTAS